ncbi:3'-5' exonuclease [Corynebacterium uropygiale]|uniref:3'-5' exonuclease n=1 Tax=Corynebacterium uropygiale TaxID=1775911 RepID=A0A9X1U1K9_9CORY|nr:3'-5' exonuclease [Corynebacterium uropygiale]MCF4007713.1 3'-5' exonuclease [Corynebacterium uropygiale]
MPPSSAGALAPLPYPVAVVDCETTGLSSEDEILELAVVLLDAQLRVETTWTSLIRPAGGVGATHIHGIREEDVAQAPSFRGVAGELASLLDGRLLAAHWARFDARFLAQECARFHVKLPSHESWTLCTCEHARTVFPDLDSHSLARCAEHCGIEHQYRHSALGDALATAELLRALHQRVPFDCHALHPLPWAELVGSVQPAEAPLSRYAWTHGGSCE